MKYSILIPTFNRPDFLEKAVKSTLLVEDKEVIICDDGSTKENRILNEKIAKQFGARYIYKANGGLSSARNELFKYSLGDYVFYLDDDDTLTIPFCKFLNKRYEHISKKYIHRFNFKKNNGEKVTLPFSWIYVSHVDIYNIAQVSTFLIERDFLEKNSMCFLNGAHTEDVIFYSKLLKFNLVQRFHKIFSILYYISPISITRSNGQEEKIKNFWECMKSEFKNEPNNLFFPAMMLNTMSVWLFNPKHNFDVEFMIEVEKFIDNVYSDIQPLLTPFHKKQWKKTKVKLNNIKKKHHI